MAEKRFKPSEKHSEQFSRREHILSPKFKDSGKVEPENLQEILEVGKTGDKKGSNQMSVGSR